VLGDDYDERPAGPYDRERRGHCVLELERLMSAGARVSESTFCCLH